MARLLFISIVVLCVCIGRAVADLPDWNLLEDFHNRYQSLQQGRAAGTALATAQDASLNTLDKLDEIAMAIEVGHLVRLLAQAKEVGSGFSEAAQNILLHPDFLNAFQELLMGGWNVWALSWNPTGHRVRQDLWDAQYTELLARLQLFMDRYFNPSIETDGWTVRRCTDEHLNLLPDDPRQPRNQALYRELIAEVQTVLLRHFQPDEWHVPTLEDFANALMRWIEEALQEKEAFRLQTRGAVTHTVGVTTAYPPHRATGSRAVYIQRSSGSQIPSRL